MELNIFKESLDHFSWKIPWDHWIQPLTGPPQSVHHVPKHHIHTWMEVATSLGTLLVTKFSIIPNLNLPSGNLRPLPLIPLLVTWEKSWALPGYNLLPGSCDCTERAVLQFWRLLGASRLGSSDAGSVTTPGSPQPLNQSQNGKCPPHRLCLGSSSSGTCTASLPSSGCCIHTSSSSGWEQLGRTGTQSHCWMVRSQGETLLVFYIKYTWLLVISPLPCKVWGRSICSCRYFFHRVWHSKNWKWDGIPKVSSFFWKNRV